MRRRVFTSAIAGLALAGVLAPVAGSPALAADTTTGSISGIVRDTKGHVLAGSMISIRPETTGAWNLAWTDANGRFKMTGVQPDGYKVEVGDSLWTEWAPGKRTEATAAVYQVNGGHNTIVNSVVSAPAALKGKVVDAAGKPAAGIPVTAADGTGLIFPSTTAADGTYKIKVRPDTAYTLMFQDGAVQQFSPSGTTGEAQAIKYTSGTDSTTTQVPRQKLIVAPRLTGRLTDAAGAPVAGATVAWTTVGANFGLVGSTTTDTDGQYVFAKVAVGTVQISFQTVDGRTQWAQGKVNPWEADTYSTTPGHTTVVNDQLLPLS